MALQHDPGLYSTAYGPMCSPWPHSTAQSPTAQPMAPQPSPGPYSTAYDPVKAYGPTAQSRALRHGLWPYAQPMPHSPAQGHSPAYGALRIACCVTLSKTQ